MPALSASRHDPKREGLLYYRHLIKTRSFKKIQAVCAVMRKLLQAIHAMLNNRTPYRQLPPPFSLRRGSRLIQFMTPTRTASYGP